MGQVHVLTGPVRRRIWLPEEKAALVGAAFAPGAVVAEVARRSMFGWPMVPNSVSRSRRRPIWRWR